MSEDGYDDESPDDEIEESLKSPASEALERLQARERPTDEDAKIIEPFYQKLANQERVPFLIVDGGLFLGVNRILYPDYRGGHYVRSICQSADRIHRQDQCISPRELDSEGTVGSGGMLYSGDPEDYFEGHDDDDGYDWETPYQQAGHEDVIDRKDMRLYNTEAKKLEAAGETIETSEALAYYRKLLGETTHQGNIKNADTEGEKIRQRVFQNIKNFYEMLEGKEYGNVESRKIAAYFRKHIKYRHGNYCYLGERKFKYS